MWAALEEKIPRDYSFTQTESLNPGIKGMMVWWVAGEYADGSFETMNYMFSL
jgi:hypothetical protein